MMNTLANHGFVQHNCRNLIRVNTITGLRAAMNFASTGKLNIRPGYNRELGVKRYLLYTVSSRKLYQVDNGWSKLTLKIYATN